MGAYYLPWQCGRCKFVKKTKSNHPYFKTEYSCNNKNKCVNFELWEDEKMEYKVEMIIEADDTSKDIGPGEIPGQLPRGQELTITPTSVLKDAPQQEWHFAIKDFKIVPTDPKKGATLLND